MITNASRGGKDDLFICTQSTTYAEVTSAIAKGKIPVLYSNGIPYYLSGGDDGDVIPYYTFSAQLGTYGMTAFASYQLLNTDVWQIWNMHYISSSTIDNSSTNQQIPTALAVYNALQNAGGGASLKYAQVTLDANSWSSNTQTLTISGITSDSTIWINAADGTRTYFVKANVRATAQATNSLTFACTDQSIAEFDDILVDVIWTEPESSQ